MVVGVSGRMYGLEGPAVASDNVAISDCVIGLEVQVSSMACMLVEVGPSCAQGMGPLGVARCTCDALEWFGGGRMIAVRVRNEDMGYRFIGDCGEKGVHMAIHQRTGVDYRNITMANDISSCAMESERAGVFGDNPTDQRRHLINLAIIKGQVSNERNLSYHNYPTLDALFGGQNTNVVDVLGNETGGIFFRGQKRL